MPPIGQEFKFVREARGLSHADVGSQIHIRPALLEAIEDEQWQAVGDLTSLRGLLRTYARFLDLDGGAIVARFNAEIAPHLAAPTRPAPKSRVDVVTLRSVAVGALAIIAVVLVVGRVAGSRHFHHMHAEPLVASDVQTAPPRLNASPRPAPTVSPSASVTAPAHVSPSPAATPTAGGRAASPTPRATATRQAVVASPEPTLAATPTPAASSTVTPLPSATFGSAAPMIPIQSSGG